MSTQLELSFSDHYFELSIYHLNKANSHFPPTSEFEQKLWLQALCDFYNARTSGGMHTPCDCCKNPAAKTFIERNDTWHACSDCLKKYHSAIDDYEKGLRQHGVRQDVLKPTWYRFYMGKVGGRA